MVPLSVESLLLDDLRAMFVRTVAEGTDVEQAFSAWITDDENLKVAIRPFAINAASRRGAQLTYIDVATLGFAVASGDASVRDAFADGLAWLLGRHPYPGGTPAGFEEDAVALLGFAVGARAVSADLSAVKTWFDSFCPQAETRSRPGFESLIRAVARMVVSGDSLSLIGADAAEIRIGFHRRGVMTSPVTEADENEALQALRQNKNADPMRAAVRISALDWLRRDRPVLLPVRGTVDDVCNLLRRVPAGFLKWTWEEKPRTRGGTARKWHVDHEYHVQNILWLILAPIFPDLRAEDYTPQVGQTQPRADLGIPSLRLIIEVKFLRAGGSIPELINEVSADAGLYRTPDSIYSEVVAFVWDDGRRSEQHDKLIEGLTRVPGVRDVVVMSRPGVMS